MFMCNVLVLAGFAGIILLVVPYGFYIYERRQNNSYRWCLHKALMLFGALIICIGLAWPALQIMSSFICLY